MYRGILYILMLSLVCLSANIGPAVAQEPQYGLKFNSRSYEPEMRTGLDLNPDRYFSFPTGFSMTFYAKFYSGNAPIYGYLFRIINDDGNSIDLVTGVNIVLSTSSGSMVSSIPFSEMDIRPAQWISVGLDVDLTAKKLTIRIGDHAVTGDVSDIADFDKVKIVFGKNDYPQKEVIDVPDMAIRDIVIRDESGKALYSWQLSKHTSDGVYDDVKRHFAKCENPDWILDGSGIWKKEIIFTTLANPSLAYDSDRNIIAIADQRSFYSFDLNTKLFEKHDVKKRLSYKMSSNQMFYNPADSVFYMYNLIRENEAREVIPYDPRKREWGDAMAHENSPDYRHHNRYFSSELNRLYIFGGYGHLKYKRGVLVYNVGDRTWSTLQLKGDVVAPRYLSGLGKIDRNRLLLFGGYGSETGDQSLQPHFYYDLYTIDLQSFEAKKIWTMETPPENFVVSNSLVVDTANRCFYALCYPSMKSNSEISLYKFSLDEPEYEIMADQIPFKFSDVLSYVDLFLDPTGSKLIAATFSPATDTTASVSISSLAFPPLKSSDYYQPERKTANVKLLVIIISCIGLTVPILWFRILRKRKSVASGAKAAVNAGETAGSGIVTTKKLPKKAIILFGGFQLIDKTGKDITTDFKPLLKNLFLLILLHTIKNGKGISFGKLKDILWFDKSEESANNNRGVALNKIRQIFENVGTVQLLKKGAYWTIEFEEGIYCDYYEAVLLLEKMKEGGGTQNDIKKLLSIVTGGELLPNLQVEWVDAFKSDFSNNLVDVLVPQIRRKDIHFSDSLLMGIANALFIHDPLNEDALKLKCSVLVKMGKNGLARNTYNAFAKEYSVLFATEYKCSFDQVISSS